MKILNIYNEFFHGGARILHTDVVVSLFERGQTHTACALYDRVTREKSLQHMEDDVCYKALRAHGIAVTAITPHANDGTPPGAEAVTRLETLAAEHDMLLVLKEQPLTFLREASVNKPLIVCLHRSDPDPASPEVKALIDGIDKGHITHCICCARATKKAYEEAGIPTEKISVILNGIDTERFTRDENAAAGVREEFGIPDNASVILFPARYDAMKRPGLFLQAAAAFREKRPDARFIMCGSGMNGANGELLEQAAAAFNLPVNDVTEKVLKETYGLHLAGRRQDMPALYSAADIVSSVSGFGEAYPLSLTEGLCCGAVPVATDVGDSEYIVAEGRGLLTRFENASVSRAETIARAWETVAGNPAPFREAIAADRMNFSKEHMVDAYEDRLFDIFYAYAAMPDEAKTDYSDEEKLHTGLCPVPPYKHNQLMRYLEETVKQSGIISQEGVKPHAVIQTETGVTAPIPIPETLNAVSADTVSGLSPVSSGFAARWREDKGSVTQSSSVCRRDS